MQVNAPSRLDSPMIRVGPRGSGEFKRISWDEALNIAVEWLKPLRKKAPEKLAFLPVEISRNPSQATSPKCLAHQTMQHMVDFAA